MFFYDSGKICVIAYTRCGHTSMYEHFGYKRPYKFSYEDDHYKSFETSNTEEKVVVMRNPYERLCSAVTNANHLSMSKYRKKFILEHSNLELQKLLEVDTNYKIIHFKNLSKYVAVGKRTNPTYSIRPPYYEQWMSSFYTEKEMDDEYDAYLRIVTQHEEMDVNKWHLLT